MLAADSEWRLQGVVARKRSLLLPLLLLGALVPGEPFASAVFIPYSAAFVLPQRARGTHLSCLSRMEVHDTESTAVSGVVVSSRTSIELLHWSGGCRCGEGREESGRDMRHIEC